MLTLWLTVVTGLWAAQVAANSHERSCSDNVTLCTMDFREMLISTDQFWFGSTHLENCPAVPPNQATLECTNPDTARASLSVLSRLLNLKDADDSTQLAQKIQAVSLASVTFNAPTGSLYACGHSYDVPAITDHDVDPLHLTAASSWSLSPTPAITWDAETPNTQYTVLVWDVGYYYPHGLFINCVNGSVATGTAVSGYTGPRNVLPRINPYLFAVYKQKSALDVAAVQQFLGIHTGQNMGVLKPQSLTSTFSANMEDSPSFANLMQIVGDKYSIQFHKDFLVMDNCPLLISQLPAFHTVMTVANVSVTWSDNTTTSSLEMMNTPYLTTLAVSIAVEYSTDDYSVESCCSQYSLTRGKFQPDPFSSAAERPGMARNTPRVHLSPINMIMRSGVAGEIFTLFLLDVAPALEPEAQNPFFITHWLVTNIKEGDVTTGDELAEYFGPNPFSPNAPRAYMFLLFKQPVPMLNNSLLDQFCPNGYQRCRLQLRPLLDAWDLQELVGVTWFLAEQDGFARQRIYRVLNARTKDEVCNGLKGYSDPCPADCSNSAPSRRLHKFSLPFIVTLIAVLKCFR